MKTKKEKHNLKEMWDYTRRPNIHGTEGRKVKKIMAENVPNIEINVNLQLQAAEESINNINLKTSTTKHTIIKLPETETKGKKSLKAAREK